MSNNNVASNKNAASNKNVAGTIGFDHPAITSERRRELLAIAKKVDAEEKSAIIQQAQVFFTA